MASMRDIKRRKGSIQSTGQITKAMKLVSTVKLQKAKGRAEESKPYFNHLYQTISAIFARSTAEVKERYIKRQEGGKKAFIVISSNRGLAGGYNANIVKMVTNSSVPKEDMYIYAVGRKAREALERKGYEIRKDYSEVMNSPLYSDASDISRDVMDAFENGEINEIYIVFTIFRNSVSQVPTMLRLLPTEDPSGASEESGEALMNFEPEPEEALKEIIPKYISGEIYGALIESLASENGARMQAMDNATNNAEEMIANLTLQYNRARQGSITQEITEIISGANALNE
ncbi:MAG: ATP synthase F1 subunit gamma [Lachnospiraceae bacterium]|nr:ATP synthase F1 subunit gamma [Lachnospiraceae bacterium]